MPDMPKMVGFSWRMNPNGFSIRKTSPTEQTKKTVDGSEIPRPTTVWMYSSPYKQWQLNYQLPSTGYLAGFRNHQGEVCQVRNPEKPRLDFAILSADRTWLQRRGADVKWHGFTEKPANQLILLMEEIPNNHLGCIVHPVNNGINYL